MINVLVCIMYVLNGGFLDFDDQRDIVYFSDKYLPQMNELLEEFNKETMQEYGVEQYRIFTRVL